MQTMTTDRPEVSVTRTGDVAPIFSRILVAVDRFDPEASAITYAKALAVASGARVRVVHVREREAYGRASFILETSAEAQQIVDGAVAALQSAGVDAEGVVTSALVGKTAEAILAVASDFGAKAIVLGSPGRRWFFGRRTRERLLRQSSVPVLVAARPEGGTDRPSHRTTRRAA